MRQADTSAVTASPEGGSGNRLSTSGNQASQDGKAQFPRNRQTTTPGTRSEPPPNMLIITKQGLAELAQISVRTLERMVKNGDITPLGALGGRVRFYLPDVMEELRNGKHKFGRAAAIETTGPRTIDRRPGGNLGQEIEQETAGKTEGAPCSPSREIRVPKSEIRTVNGAQKSKWRTEV